MTKERGYLPISQRHVVCSQQFDCERLTRLFYLSDEMRKNPNRSLSGKVIATLFYEPSTRTRLSFESAALHLGAQVISTENASQFSSAIKGETIEDTVRVIANYSSAIVIRHNQTGAVDQASKFSPVPIINAGDGSGQHPTQALLDAYTIFRHFGRLDNLNIQLVGDLANGRTVRSLVYLLAKFPKNRFFLVSHPSLKIGQDIIDYLKRHQVAFRQTKSLLTDCDVNYITRIQKERLKDPTTYERVSERYVIDKAFAESLPSNAIIMHPLPRVNEIKTEVDNCPQAKYFEQAGNGLYVRMAVLHQIFDDQPFLFYRGRNQ